MRATTSLLILIAGLIAGVALGFVLGSTGGGTVQAAPPLMTRTADGSSAAAAPSGPGLVGVNGTRVVTSSGPSRPKTERPLDSETRAAVERAKINVEVTDAAAGAGEIVGTVVDDQGAAMEGVTIVASNSPLSEEKRGSGRDSGQTGRAWTGDPDLDGLLEDEARSSMDARRYRRVTTSDASGRFRLEGLRAGQQSLRAYAEGYVFSSSRVHTGEAATFVAKPVMLYAIQPAFADGTVPERATVLKGEGRSITAYEWTREEPVIRLSSRSEVLRVVAGNVRSRDSRSYIAEFTSEARTVDLDHDGEGPHEFELAPSKSLFVTVEDTSNVTPRIVPWVRYAKAEKLEGKSIEEAFLRNSESIRRSESGTFDKMELGEGEYIIGAGRGQGQPEITERVTIDEDNVTLELTLGDVDLARFLVAKVKGVSGEPLSGARFRCFVKTADDTDSGSVSATERKPGEYWLPWRDVLDGDEWTNVVSVEVATTAPGLGSINQQVRRGQSEANFEFASACDLTVQVDGRPDTSYEVSVIPLRSASDMDEGTYGSSTKKRTDETGKARLTGLQPGPLKVTLRQRTERSGRRSSTKTLNSELIVLRPGGQTVTIVAVELHDLVIVAPDFESGVWFTVSSKASTGRRYWGGNGASLDEDHRATIKDLKPGHYFVSMWDSDFPGIEVDVPCGEVVFEKKSISGFKAANVDVDGPAYAAGVRDGDVAVTINGKNAAEGKFRERLDLEIGSGDVTITVIRGGAERTITLPKVSGGRGSDALDMQWIAVSD